MQYVIKIIISALIIAGVSELGKKFTPVAAVLASLPLVSILAIIWLYSETKNVQKIIDLSNGIFWAVLPSLIFFLVLPLLLKNGLKFTPAMIISAITMFITYSIYIFVLAKFGIKI
ncbi:MAG: hypothetical protein ACD_51C00249G0020 [uncultured bacterium]|uniref:DUF3147 family protein n=1 Tax=candidate division WOR-1 bacterium RIFOXYC2_FULL_41_25 TaxID=1802586 RepID=A0A1F4TKX4_UNCSA|nr:MAG: hypothetical protein ACD_51C00249G0020 [uncultured bacterium]OGC33336.1 MAG: hypothetical protein A2462_08845 [candidate division WOR-1 bacterium RIFOXYC2_FULL_41_25]OGJ47619.1 MAG: hypothetical protein A2244_00965 [Candidatus Peregrinibacteria bacterium RIFOXYA2_FULL_41_18]